jgi:uncharacterized protein YggL (DUF469 family)
MKKRLRKKLRVGEFQERGFDLSFQLSDQVLGGELDTFWDAFIATVEERGLMCGGACGRHWDVFVARPRRGSVTEDDRQALVGWLNAHPGVGDIRFGPLVDAWHSA